MNQTPPPPPDHLPSEGQCNRARSRRALVIFGPLGAQVPSTCWRREEAAVRVTGRTNRYPVSYLGEHVPLSEVPTEAQIGDAFTALFLARDCCRTG